MLFLLCVAVYVRNTIYQPQVWSSEKILKIISVLLTGLRRRRVFTRVADQIELVTRNLFFTTEPEATYFR